MKSNDVYKALFGEEYKRESYKHEGHSFQFMSRIGKQVCSNCGLVMLRNKFTDWSIRMGCLSELHPEYANARKRYTGLDK